MSENRKVSQLENMLTLNGTEYLMIIQENDGVYESRKVSLSEIINQANQLSECGIFTSKVTVSSEQLLRIGTEPVELIGSPGVGKKIELMAVSSVFHAGGNSYSSVGGVYGIIYQNDYAADLGVTIAEIKGSDNIPLSMMKPFCDWGLTSFNSSETYGGLSFSLTPENQAIILSTDDRTSAEDGDGSLVIYVTYKIVTL